MSDTVDIVVPPPGGIDFSTAPPVVIEVGGESPVIVDVTTPPPIVIEIGTIGAQGPPGVSNVPGPEGPAGIAGADGAPGPQGDKGETGDPGPAGSQGPQGAQGIQGAQGEAGSGITMQGSVATADDLPTSAVQGDAYIVQLDDSLWIYDGTAFVSGGSIQGPPGAQGPMGPQGIQGAQGSKGDTGEVGPQGSAGAQGVQGIQGPQGATGSTGSTGPAGPGFSDGDKGDIVIAGSGTSLTFDSAVVTAAARALLDDADAAAQRTTLGTIGDAPNDGSTYVRQSAAWIQMPAATSLSTAEYTYQTSGGMPPSTGQMRVNNATQSSITELYPHKTNAVGVDISNALKLIATGDKILVQDKTTSSNNQNYVASGPSVDSGSYFTVPVTWASGGSNFTVGRVIFAVFGLGTGGAGGTGVSEAPTDGKAYSRRGSTTSWVAATISTSAPSGGADGDVWYQVT